VIEKKGWFSEAYQVLQALDFAHRDFSNYVTWLRNSGIAVWTHIDDTSTIPEAEYYSLIGWMTNWRRWFNRFVAFEADYGAANINTYYPGYGTKLASAIATLPTLKAAFDTVLDLHRDAGVLKNEPVPMGQRNALADALEAELEV
jgi:hypothetical protein